MVGDRTAESHGPIAARACAAFLRWVDDAGEPGREFLQVWIRRGAEGRYDVRHRADRGGAIDHLDLRRSPAATDELARTTEAGRHRPMRSAPDLRRGWLFADLDGRQLWTVLNALYPAAAIHWFQGISGSTNASSFFDTALRQTGIYTVVRELNGERLSAVVRASCGRSMCLRDPVWDPAPPALERTGSPEAQRRESPGRAVVPCSRPCSLLIAFAREVARTEADRAVLERFAPTPADRFGLACALRSIADYQAGAGELACETADFTCRLNPRWLRYWAERLENGGDRQVVEPEPSSPAIQLLWIPADEAEPCAERAARPASTHDPDAVACILALVACATAEIVAACEDAGAPAASISVLVRSGRDRRDPRCPDVLDIRFRLAVRSGVARHGVGDRAESRLHAYRSLSGAMLRRISATWAVEVAHG
jgi:hypothetical protein